MKKSLIKNISLGIACLLGVGGAIAAASAFNFDKPFEEARADGIQYIFREWNETNKEVEDTSKTCGTYTTVTSGITLWTDGVWYVVNGDVTISSRITVTGTANLILCDGVTLTTSSGISVNSGNTLNIYSQSNDSGKLVSTVTSTDLRAAIGGDNETNGGTINIRGGDIESTGSKAAAAIGGGANGGAGGTITIYGGKVTANAYSGEGLGSGIGGGSNGTGGTITIYGGTVNAYGTTEGAGIGGGAGSAAAGGTITIYGGNVTATSRGVCAAIGGGPGASGGEITIYGGIITATNTGGNDSDGDGAGIGGGIYATGGSVTISGGIVTATGGNNGANGIGAGKGGTNGSLKVTNGLTVLGGNTANPTTIINKVDDDYERYQYMVVKLLHEHNWSYTADGASITAECQNSGCPITTGLTLTIGAPSDLVYSGTAKTAVLNSFSAVAFGTPEISYYKDNVLVSECVDVGTYEARVTVGGETATKSFAITKAEYISRSWDETNKEVVSTPSTCETYTIIASDTTSWTNGVWYVVSSDVTISSRISVTGTVNLILCDGKTLTASQGIEVLTGNTLNIYGQSGDTGKIIATAPDEKTCIGGSNASDGGSINIQGGWIEANNHSGTFSTGIGGGNGKGFDSIEIYGGTVLATGSYYAPAIGSHRMAMSEDSKTITIYGGSVIATGGDNAAAIGGGPGGLGESVTISGGSVIATGGANASGIGIGGGVGPMGGTVSITGGYVTATGGSGGAGIGGVTISISGGHINATGVDDGAGIGSGTSGSGPSVTISGGEVTATGGSTFSAGIGKSVAGGNHGTLEVTNGLTVLGGNSSESLTTKTAEQYADSRWQYMKVGNFHTHNFISYSASGNVITATCDNADGNCPLLEYKATLTISAPIGSLIYDGTAKEATYVDTSSGTAFSDITSISYSKGGEGITGSPIDAGTYVAAISCNEGIASIEYTISKADASLTAPTAKTDLTYTGSAQALVNAGSTSDGTIYYRLADGEYSTDIPTGINAGTYNVYYKLIGDNNHNNIDETGPIEVTIDKADVTLTPPEGTIIRYDGDNHELVTSGSVTGGALFYKLGDEDYSTSIPTASNLGTYDIYYKVVGDSNHKDIAETGPIHSSIVDAVAYLTDGSTVTTYGSITDAVSAWNSANAGATLTLLKDIVTSSSITISGNKILDLNGFGIRASGTGYNVIVVSSGNYLTIKDSDPTHAHAITLSGWQGTSVSDGTGTTSVDSNGNGTAYITGGYITGGKITSGSNKGACIYINGGTVDLYSGSLIGNYVSYNGCDGGCIYVENSGYFKMYGGSIRYNYSGNAGGGIGTDNATIEINGGVISFNRNNYSGGSAISLNNSSTLKLYGGVIENNVSYHADGAICFKSADEYFDIKGSPIVRNNTSIKTGNVLNIYLNTGVVAHIEGPLSEEADIHLGIISNNTRVFTDGWSTHMAGKNPDDYFFSDNPNYSVYLKTGEAYYGVAPSAKVQNGETITYYENFTDALTNWTVNTTLTLLKDVTTSATISITNVCNLDLNGFGIKATGTDYSVLTINNGGKLTIIDSGDTTQYFTVVDRYVGNMAGFATVCDKATYDAAAENARGTFQGGYITGGNIIGTGFYQSKAGAITVMTGGELDFKAGTIIGNSGGTESPGGVSSFGTFTLNGGNIIYNRGRRGSGVFVNEGTFVMNSGSIEYNTGVGANEYGTTAFHAYNAAQSISFNGGSVSHNYTKYGGIATASNIYLSGDFVAVDNVACGPSGTEAANGNIMLGEGALLRGCITGNTPIGIYLDTGSGVFTNNTDTSLNDPSKFISDNPNYAIGVYPASHTKAGQLFIGNKVTVTYNNNGHGDVPTEQIIANGGLIFDSPTPTVEGYDFKGWYKEAECENIWDFDNDTVTEDITLYALWDYDAATANVIKLINDIGTLTYDGGSNDSLADILAAKTAYDALTPGRKVIVDGVNKDVLDHDITTYKNVDKVGDLINAIPEPSPDKSYYDAIDLAITEYNKLTEEEVIILNSVINYQEFLNDNIAARKVIIEIEEIGEVTYDGGINDSKKDIEKAEKSYDELSKDQKDIVDYVNHDVLVDDREIYDQMAKAIKAIKEIGKVENNEETKEKIEEARKIYDSLPDELKDVVKNYDNSLKVLEDDEKVLDVLVLIDDIGDVNYDSASQEKIQEARRHYDSLTDDQKRLIAPEVLEILEEKEATYTSMNNTGNSLLVVFLIISGLLLILGLIVMYFIIRKKKEDNGDDNNDNSANKSKTMKLASFTGLMPFIIYASHYLDSGYILLYIIIALTVIVWLTNLVLFILKKKGLLNKKKEESKPIETAKEPEPVKPVNEEEEEEVVTITDEKGNIFNIRYIKSFTAKLIQSPDETKKYYEELKNYVLSYKKTTSRVSWHYDSINSGRNQALKFAIRGKTLCVYYPLNANDYLDTKYKVEAVESKKFEEVPCLYRIKNDRRLGYAKDLIDTVMANLGLIKGEEQHEVYSNLPYEPNAPLIARGLIKELKVQVNKPVEQVVSKKVNDEGDEIVTTRDARGNIFEIRYIKSFTAKLSQASAEVKDYYNELKNYALGYKKANSRVSWHFDSINVGRNQVIKFSIRGKTLCVYYALNANDYNDTKYKVEVVESKKFEEVPCLYRIKNDRRRDYAKDLIDTVMANVPTEKGKESNEDFRIPHESTKALLAKGLIKENKVQVNKPVEDKPVEQMSEDEEEVITITDEKGNIFNIRYIKSFTAKLIQSPEETKKYYEELKNYVLSYKKTTSRISWHYDSINSGRNQVIKFSIRGKTLCVYYALDANNYLDTKYKVEAVESKKFEEVPCLYRIKNDRRLDYAKDLIDTVMNNLVLVKGEEQHEVYSNLPYEPNAPLIARGLIKELKVQVNKPAAPVVIKAEEVDAKMSDEEATSKISENVESKRHHGKKGIINIDVIARDFNNNEVVNIEALWKKKIISTNIGHVKVLARGSLDKKLHFELQDYSLQAVKMILLAGGTVKKVK